VTAEAAGAPSAPTTPPSTARRWSSSLKRASAASASTLKLVSLPSERSLVAANLGEVDGEGLRVAGLGGPGSPYPNLVQVPERFVRISFVAFSRDATIPLDNGWDSLKPYRIAFINGWKMFEANALGARVVHKVDKPEQLFRMLEEGRVDLALYTRADGIRRWPATSGCRPSRPCRRP
jgi:polar amino acid transport system substrate-binding protein